MCTRSFYISNNPLKQLRCLWTAIPQQLLGEYKLVNTVAVLHVGMTCQQQSWQHEHPSMQMQLSSGVCLSYYHFRELHRAYNSTSSSMSRCFNTTPDSTGKIRSSRSCNSCANGSQPSSQSRRCHSSRSSSSTHTSMWRRGRCCTRGPHQKASVACGNGSEHEKKSTAHMFYCFAETYRTWPSVAIFLRHRVSALKPDVGIAAAMQRSRYTRTTAAIPTHDTAVETSAVALGYNTHLRSQKTGIKRCALFMEVGAAATATRKTATCATRDVALPEGGGKKLDQTAAGETKVCRNMPVNGGTEGSATTQQISAKVPAAKREVATTPVQTSAATGESEQRREPEEAAARARTAEGLWNTLVPERNWGVKSPMFWVLLVLVLLLHAYNNKRDKEKAAAYTEEDEAEKQLREEVERRRQERRTWLKQIDSQSSKTETH